MGTNYYLKTKKCKTCGHKEEGIHLGKSSHGWKFSFQYNGGKYYKNVKEMKAWLKGKEIEDEYGGKISHTSFWKMVEEKQKENLSHAELGMDGYSFLDTEFC